MEDELLLKKLNSFTRREHSKDEVYIFDVILCDNDIDRDNEAFSDNALDSLQKLFIGKTGVFDHNPKGSNQTSRIFDTEVVLDESKIMFFKPISKIDKHLSLIYLGISL